MNEHYIWERIDVGRGSSGGGWAEDMYAYVTIYIYTHTHTQIHTSVHTHIHAHTNTHKYNHTAMY